MTDEFSKIQAFLSGWALDVPKAPGIRKAGIIPFLLGDPLRYYVMTPVANKPDLGLPEFQLCKGTRMYKGFKGWADMKGVVPDGAELEPLAATAIREGIEELGLKLENIRHISTLGEHRFTSATNRKEIDLWLFAAEMKTEHDFLPQAEVAASTHERRWYTLEEFKKHGRPDHAHILSLVEQRLL